MDAPFLDRDPRKQFRRPMPSYFQRPIAFLRARTSPTPTSESDMDDRAPRPKVRPSFSDIYARTVVPFEDVEDGQTERPRSAPAAPESTRTRSTSSASASSSKSSKVIGEMFARAEREEAAKITRQQRIESNAPSSDSRDTSPTPSPRQPDEMAHSDPTQRKSEMRARIEQLYGAEGDITRDRVARHSRLKRIILQDYHRSMAEKSESDEDREYHLSRLAKYPRSPEKSGSISSASDFTEHILAGEDHVQTPSEDIPLPSIEMGESIPQEPTPPTSRPASAQPYYQTTPNKNAINHEWMADVDFTAQSLSLATSPMLRVKPATLDTVRDREIKTLAARAVATNRLEEIRERNSEERYLFSESLRNKEATPNPEEDEPQGANVTIMGDYILEGDGQKIPGTPITVYSKDTYRPRSASVEQWEERQRLKREESHDALRKLARLLSPAPQRFADSEDGDDEKEKEGEPTKAKRDELVARRSKTYSPKRSPERSQEDQTRLKTKEASSNTLAEKVEFEKQISLKNNTLDADTKRRSTASSPPKSDADPEERIAAEAKLFDIADNKSERDSIHVISRSPSPSSDDESRDREFDETPRAKSKVDPLSFPTPRVMGAYIETPAPVSRKARRQRSHSPPPKSTDKETLATNERSTRSEHSTKKDEKSISQSSRSTSSSTSSQKETQKPRDEAQKSQRPVINTAKITTATEDLKRIQRESQYEDSTLDEFDAFLSSNSAAINDTGVDEAILDLEYDDRGLPLSEPEKKRRVEMRILERMNRRLKSTSHNIRDARQGIERLEQTVSAVVPVGSQPTQPAQSRLSDDYVDVHINFKVPKLWTETERPQARNTFLNRNWKFTWFGFILFVFGSWFIAESAMCEVYCHPEFSSKNTWRPDDPFFPYAIPTQLDRWTGKVASRTIKKIWKRDSSPKFDNMGRVIHPSHAFAANDWWLGANTEAPIVTGSYDTMEGDEVL